MMTEDGQLRRACRFWFGRVQSVREERREREGDGMTPSMGVRPAEKWGGGGGGGKGVQTERKDIGVDGR